MTHPTKGKPHTEETQKDSESCKKWWNLRKRFNNEKSYVCSSLPLPLFT
jgi:hypothetical protein